MNLYDFVTTHTFTSSGIALVLILALIQIAPININPWSALFRIMGNALNKNLMQRLEELALNIEITNKKVDNLSNRILEDNAIDARYRILRFGDEVSHKVNHSKDHFMQILGDITYYHKYCEEHPDFKNNITKLTVERIEDDYKHHETDQNFL